MKKFAMLLMALSVSLFTLGCQPSPKAKEGEKAKPAATAPEGEKKPADTAPAAPSDKPAEPEKK